LATVKGDTTAPRPREYFPRHVRRHSPRVFRVLLLLLFIIVAVFSVHLTRLYAATVGTQSAISLLGAQIPL